MATKKAERNEPANQKANEELDIAAQEAADANREPGDEGPGKKYAPEANPRPWAHSNKVGVEFFTHREPYQSEIVFEEKPSQAVIDHLKDNGFEWKSQAKLWARPNGYKTDAQDKLTARRIYNQVVDMMLEEKGLPPEKQSEIAF